MVALGTCLKYIIFLIFIKTKKDSKKLDSIKGGLYEKMYSYKNHFDAFSCNFF